MTKVKASLLGIRDLLPQDAEELRWRTYRALASDPASTPSPKHSRRSLGLKDSRGRKKIDTYCDAITGRLDWFEKVIENVTRDPFGSLPPSLRSYLTKDGSKETRPIDDPSELKRLVLLGVADKVGDLFDDHLTAGQFGGRAMSNVDQACPRPGATVQDHVAWRLQDLVYNGRPYVLSIDLADAFGHVSRRAVVDRSQAVLGLDRQAARWLWRLLRIDAIDWKTRRRVEAKKGRGIEQGNLLSTSVMNLVLADPIRVLEQELGVVVITYVDDIYVCCSSVAQARIAFEKFVDLMSDLGMTNVRVIGTGRKDSKIIDARVAGVPVLKTYEVRADGISLLPEKVVQTWRQLFKKGVEPGLVRVPLFRKKGGVQAVGERWLRESGSLVFPKAQDEKDFDKMKFRPDRQVKGRRGPTEPDPLGEMVKKDSQEDEHMVGDPDPVQGEGDFRSSSVQGDGVEGPSGDAPLHGEQPSSSNRPLVDERLHQAPSRVRASSGSMTDPSRSVRGAVEVREGHVGKSRGTPAAGPVKSDGGGDAASEPGDTGGAGNQGRSPSPTPTILLSVTTPLVADRLRRGLALELHDERKPARGVGAVDVRGLELLVDDYGLGIALRAVLKAVRLGCRVAVVVDPRQPWVHLSHLLGGDDGVYRRVGEPQRFGDSWMVHLVHRRWPVVPDRQPPGPPPRRLPRPPSGVHFAVHGVRRSGTGSWKVVVEDRDGTRLLRETSRNPGPLGAAEVLAKVVNEATGTVAVRSSAVANLALAPGVAPVAAVLGLARAALHPRRWERVGDWWIGS